MIMKLSLQQTQNLKRRFKNLSSLRKRSQSQHSLKSWPKETRLNRLIRNWSLLQIHFQNVLAREWYNAVFAVEKGKFQVTGEKLQKFMLTLSTNMRMESVRVQTCKCFRTLKLTRRVWLWVISLWKAGNGKGKVRFLKLFRSQVRILTIE